MNAFKKVIASALAIGLIGGIVVAAPKHKVPTCPKCKMELSKKKDDKHTIAVKTKKGTMYCCAGCGMKEEPTKGKDSKSK